MPNAKDFIRDPKRVLAQLKEKPDNTVITTQGCKIYIPLRFTEKSLADLGHENYIVGMFAMVVENKYYAFCNINALVQITPDAINKVRFEADEYLEFVFEPGSQVIANMNLVVNDVLTFRIYDEFISKGNIPWYMNYEDAGNMFSTASKHAGVSVGANPEVIEMLIAIIFRDAKDRNTSLRYILKSKEDLNKIEYVTIPLRSVAYAASNTVNKLAGSYFSVGLNSALVNPAERTERIETILRA